MTKAQYILQKIEEKGLIKSALKGAALGAGSAIIIHLGKSLSKKRKEKNLHPAAKRRLEYEENI